jgi:hypothetical protein
MALSVLIIALCRASLWSHYVVEHGHATRLASDRHSEVGRGRSRVAKSESRGFEAHQNEAEDRHAVRGREGDIQQLVRCICHSQSSCLSDACFFVNLWRSNCNITIWDIALNGMVS